MFAPDKFEDPDVGVEGDDFAKARNFILAASKTVVTDDSGVPLKFFDREKWGVTAHGPRASADSYASIGSRSRKFSSASHVSSDAP